MNRVFKILYKPASVFEQLNDFYEDDLNTDSNIITSVLGFLLGIYSCYIDFESFKEISSGIGIVLIFILAVIAFNGIFLLFYNYILTYILYWIGKLLNGRGLVAEIRAAIAYSILPGIFGLVLMLIQGLNSELLFDANKQLIIVRILSVVTIFWSMIILVVGLKIFNKYGFIKAVVNVLVLPLSALIVYNFYIK